MTNLTQKKCVPCEGGEPALAPDKVEELLKQAPSWQLVEANNHPQIERVFEFKDFKEALEFVNKVGELVEQEGHHPNIYLHSWNKVKLELYTHAIGGLHENDFIVAAKVNELVRK